MISDPFRSTRILPRLIDWLIEKVVDLREWLRENGRRLFDWICAVAITGSAIWFMDFTAEIIARRIIE